MTEERKNSLTPLRRRRVLFQKRIGCNHTLETHFAHTYLHTFHTFIFIIKFFLGILYFYYRIWGGELFHFDVYEYDLKYILLYKNTDNFAQFHYRYI